MRLTGEVVRGESRGKKFFVPTINLGLDAVPNSLDFGVYVVWARIENKEYFGVMHYGKRVTVDNKLTLEVHVFDFNKNIYGEKVNLKVLDKLREVEKFATKEALKKAIDNDIVLAKELISEKY